MIAIRVFFDTNISVNLLFKMHTLQKWKRPKLLALGAFSCKFVCNYPSFKAPCAELDKVFPCHQVESEKQL